MVSATGIGSGLDIEGLVTQLVNAERAPAESRLLRQESRLTAELSAFGTLKGALEQFQDGLSTLGEAGTFARRSASSTDSAVVSASAGSDAAPGTLAITVDSLASSQSLASGAFASADTVVGEGTLTLNFGTVGLDGSNAVDTFTQNPDRDSVTVTIDGSNNTLAGVRDAINAADAGVSAALVNDGGGVRLLLTSEQTGAANAVEIRVSDSDDGNDFDANGLSRLAFNSDATNLEQTAAGTDAAFTLNGLALSSAENTVADVVDGVTLQLRGVSEPGGETITIAQDRGAVRSAIEAFVEGYNSLVRTSNNLTRFDAETGDAGALQGDFSARSIVSQVRNAVTGSVPDAGSLAEFGITTTSDGTLTIDAERLDSALQDDLDGLAQLFSGGSDGIAVRTDAVLDGFLRSGGLFDSRTEGIQGRVDGIEESREALNRRLEALEARYRAQFNALDSLLAELQSTSDFVSQQLANIPLPGDSSN